MVDLVISGDCVVTPHSIGPADVAISGEKVVAIAERGAFPLSANARRIDAIGKIVMPGGIDPHTHCLWPTYGPGGAIEYTKGPSVVGKAALFGGTTTIIDFTRWTHGKTVQGAIEERMAQWREDGSPCDWALHTMVEGDLPPEIPAQLGEAIEAGHASVKIFTTDITPSRKGRMVDFGDIWEVFQVLAKKGGLGVIHAEDNDIVMHMYAKLFREGRTGFENMAEVHNTLSEDLSFRRVLRLAEHVPGTALYMLHVSAANGVHAIRAARGKNQPVYGESLHQYMLYTQEDYKRPNGQIYHTYPSLKSQADQDELWRGAMDGSINCVATDELCCSLAVKTQGKQIDDTTGGNSGVEPRVAVMYSEMVGKRRFTLRQFVDAVSTNAARIMGLYPRKGCIAPGADADICILDPALKRTVRAEVMHESDYSPWEGREVNAWPSMTILRGKVVVEGDKWLGDDRGGTWLSRKVPEEIRAGAAL
ncbi:amidohydrolase family protein [Siccirubricoccus sp. KC 17139]|uniref:Amidohydrolase family protein n=1 Tax=Siccirubricoccus soli TaxID=2899147 RepID=A0ABT1CY72_9PROT|nr:amidohydrolase family protein [Siccirubricoccus soli]MCO6414613.1 amidohydrolase family protein [Siccirubricoccus soli]MCP2680743.1 amidohydrolase family protein [Siccirubricoccus soli]